MNKDPRKDDSMLIEACINRDLAAWAKFVNKYSTLISIAIERRLRYYNMSASREDIEDIKQELLSSIWKERKLESIKNRQDISYWLAIVAGNKALEYMRKKRNAEPVKTISIFDDIENGGLVELLPSKDAGPRNLLAKDEIAKSLKAAIESLIAKERLVIKLNLFYNKKQDEIAKMLDMPEGTVSSYIKRAKEKLKESLKDFV